MKALLFITLFFLSFKLSAQSLTDFEHYMVYPSINNSSIRFRNEGWNAHFSAQRKWMSIPDAGRSVLFQLNTPLLGKMFYGIKIQHENIHRFEKSGLNINVGRQFLLDETKSINLGVNLEGYSLYSGFTPLIYSATSTLNQASIDPVYSVNQRNTALGLTSGLNVSFQTSNGFVSISKAFYQTHNTLTLQTTNSQFNSTYNLEGLYKFRPSDVWVIFPSVNMQVNSDRFKLRGDFTVLFDQIILAGIGINNDLSVPFNVGVFLEKGLRLIYGYTTAQLSQHPNMTSTHSLTLSLVKPQKK